MLFITSFALVLLVSSIRGQISTALPYVCVPTGTCPTNSNNTNTIEPRIVTQSPCPAGQEACFIPTPTVQCGRRFVQTVNTADGPASVGAYPWLAYITNQTGYTGAGVLLNARTVLTAAHKVYPNVATPQNINVKMGVYNPSNTAGVQTSTAASIHVFPTFNLTTDTLINDIAIIRLNTPIIMGAQTNVGPACLPTASPPGSSQYTRMNCTVAGWGVTQFGLRDASTTPLKQVTVPIVTYETCRASLGRSDILGSFVDKYLDPRGEICAGGGAQRDACTQDGGSPLMCQDPTTQQFSIAGLVIWGKKCGLPGVYGVYVNVPVYRGWIDSVMASFQ